MAEASFVRDTARNQITAAVLSNAGVVNRVGLHADASPTKADVEKVCIGDAFVVVRGNVDIHPCPRTLWVRAIRSEVELP